MNDKYYEIYNYFNIITRFPKDFENFKKGVFGLISQKLWEDIRDGKIRPRNRIEKAYFFYYMNKMTRAGNPQHKAKASFRGMLPPTNSKKNVIEKIKKDFENLTFKDIRVNNTRPETNNDNGLLTPIDPRVIEKLRYVTLTCKDFRDAYSIFHKKYHIERGLTKEAFIYFDPPYPGKEAPYYHIFQEKDHLDLIEILLNCPFRFMLSIGGDCEFYLDAMRDAGYYIDEIPVKHSTNARYQYEKIEYCIMNYNYKTVPKPIEFEPESNQLSLTKFLEVSEN